VAPVHETGFSVAKRNTVDQQLHVLGFAAAKKSASDGCRTKSGTRRKQHLKSRERFECFS
jgi:hypothetical protein